MNEKESLNIILNMIDRTKDNLRQQSPFYLVWGGAIFAAAIIEYGLLVFSENPNHHVVWPVAILIAVALTVYPRHANRPTEES